MYKLHKDVRVRKKRLAKSERFGLKVIHKTNARKPQKSSYTRSYSRYPQKMRWILRYKKVEKRTTVL